MYTKISSRHTSFALSWNTSSLVDHGPVQRARGDRRYQGGDATDTQASASARVHERCVRVSDNPALRGDGLAPARFHRRDSRSPPGTSTFTTRSRTDTPVRGHRDGSFRLRRGAWDGQMPRVRSALPSSRSVLRQGGPTTYRRGRRRVPRTWIL